ncbi:MAG: tRNA (adenosine(37)-N6)-threonylcarbamoyltransferase complex dimerization subunit type 1 TsaB [Candidatus Aminicenantia bacterium]
MLTLALDTSTDIGSVAIMEDDRLIGALFFSQKKGYSQVIIPSIDLLLSHHSLSIKDLDGFSVSVGPGSFTGIRIGISCIKAFALAFCKKIAPVSSLYALAFKLRDKENSLICPTIDAKKGEIFGALYLCENGALKVIIEEGSYKPEGFFRKLPGEKIYFLGNAVYLFREKIIETFRGEPIFPDLNLFLAEEVGKIGYKILTSGLGKAPDEIAPSYLRPSEAELKKSS